MSVRSFASRTTLLSLFALTGCGLGALQQRNDAIHNMNAQAQANAIAAQANARTDKFVIVERAWLCETEAQAASGTACDGGKPIRKNRVVTVVGQAPKNGVWPASVWDKTGEQRFFVAAASLNELPDTTELDGFEQDVARRYPEQQRIPLRAVNFVDLLTQAKAYRGRFLVTREQSVNMTNKEFADGVFSFTIPIPVKTGSQWLALAQFELENQVLVEDFQKGERSYQCGGAYCDHFVIVAELTGRTVERIDELGNIRKLPVFAVRELGDRYGMYKAR